MNKLATLLLAVPAIPLTTWGQNSSKPDIILIMADQMRFDCLGAMGNPDIITPNLDRLAKDGALFMEAYSSTPSSTPARAGLLTGCSPWQHGLLGYGQQAVRYAYEMPRMLHDDGYYAFGIGKNHYHPQANLHGFDCVLLDESDRVEDPFFISDYHKWFQLQAPGENPDSSHLSWNGHDGGVYPLPERLHPTHWIGATAVEFIRNYKCLKPLFLKVSFERPHSPYDPPKRFFDMYRHRSVPKHWVGDWCDSLKNYPNTTDAAFGDFGEANADSTRRYYYANVTFDDTEIGNIIKALKKKGLYDKSWIIFIADHGDMMGDLYHWRKTYPYESSAHIPFIVKPPKNSGILGKRGEKIYKVVELRDVLPTFLEAAEIKQPSGMDGMSLFPLLKNPQAPWRPYIDMEHAACYIKSNYWVALTDGHVKYIWYFTTGREEIFDLQKDPHELKDLAKDKEFEPVLIKWRDRMTKHLMERGYPYVKDGELHVFQKSILYGPNYPKSFRPKHYSSVSIDTGD